MGQFRYSELKPCHIGTFDDMTAAPTSSTSVFTLSISEVLDRCSFRDRDEEMRQMANVTLDELTDEQFEIESLALDVQGEYRRYAAFFTLSLEDSVTGKVISEAHKVLSEPKHALGLLDPNMKAHAEVEKEESQGGSVFRLRLSVERPALFVYLDSALEGTFSANGFILWRPSSTVIFRSPQRGIALERFRKSLTVLSYFNEDDCPLCHMQK